MDTSRMPVQALELLQRWMLQNAPEPESRARPSDAIYLRGVARATSTNATDALMVRICASARAHREWFEEEIERMDARREYEAANF